MKIKSLIPALAGLLLYQVSALAVVDLGAESSYTPYDSYMRPVRKVLGSVKGEKATMDKVKDLMKVGRGFRYSFTDPYTAALPHVTAATRKGDCKAKSLWIIDQMGDENVRYVIGKARRTSRISHAWVMWNNGGRWWILDPTNTARPIAAEKVGSDSYIPYYSWDTSGNTFRHTTTRSMVSSVAGKGRKAAVASRGTRD